MSQLQKDVKDLMNIAVRLKNSLDNKKYRNALLALKSVIKTVHQAAYSEELDCLIDIFGSNNPKHGKKKKDPESEPLTTEDSETKKSGFFRI